MNSTIAVFGAAGTDMNEDYYRAAREFGALTAQKGWRMVFGGSDSGAMGAAAHGSHESGGYVTGVIPERLHDKGIAYASCDEMIVTRDLRDRMSRMNALSDGFCVLPGGFGTLYELFEVFTLNQLGYISKPVVLLNTRGYYDPLLEMFESMYAERGAREGCRLLYTAVNTPAQAIACFESRLTGGV